jgi:hypothetical protein
VRAIVGNTDHANMHGYFGTFLPKLSGNQKNAVIIRAIIISTTPAKINSTIAATNETHSRPPPALLIPRVKEGNIRNRKC